MNETRILDLDDVRWELGRFGKHIYVRFGKGSRRRGPKPRLVPLIDGADRTLRWFVEDVWGHFDLDHTRIGVSLSPSERKNADGPGSRALRPFCASLLYLGGMSLFAIQDLEPGPGMSIPGVPCRGGVAARAAAGRQAVEGSCDMKSNLRLAAANRGIWKASEIQRLLAERGLVISAGKMSSLWSGQPNTVRLDELDVICAVLDCGVAKLLLAEPPVLP